MAINPVQLQAGATVLLVILTGYYAFQTRKTVTLMSNQFRRESLRYHTQVLRNIVNNWLDNLPTVTAADVDNPSGTSYVGHPAIDDEVDDWEGWFWVTPIHLEDDPYYEDFLSNHADELGQIREAILDSFDQFWSLREDFIDNYSDSSPLEELPFRSERTDWFNLWAFETAVILERGILSKEELYQEVIRSNENWRMAQTPPTKTYVGDSDKKEILRCDVLRGDEPADSEVIDEREEMVYSAIKQVIGRLENQEKYENAEEAAKLLDELDDLVNRLETKLEEYAGMEVYKGECDYLFKLD